MKTEKPSYALVSGTRGFQLEVHAAGTPTVTVDLKEADAFALLEYSTKMIRYYRNKRAAKGAGFSF